MRELMGWGRYPRIRGEERVSEDLVGSTRGAVLSRGLGRSYGDASLPPLAGGVVACTRLANRVLSFDDEGGVLRAEAGFSLSELNSIYWRRGWASPVTPGTQYVTLGGMVASDVHGKNHHVSGCFGEHVRALKMRVADGRILEVDERTEPDLFRATLGGMGLTGHILEVEAQLERIPSPWIYGESERVDNLDQLIHGLREASAEWPMTVSWVDFLSRGRKMGRGIVTKGRWAEPHEAPEKFPADPYRLAVPIDFPGWVLGRPSIRAFNELYYRKHGRRVHRGILNPNSFFYPLDAIRDWNRIYGARGFTQYQCVLPHADAGPSCRRFFDTLTELGGASFLGVIKDCGAEGKGMLSFPKLGISIALDIAMRGEQTRLLVSALNKVVIEAGGRVYLTKDALSTAADFLAMEPRFEAWNAVRRKWDPEATLRSALSERLMGDPS